MKTSWQEKVVFAILYAVGVSGLFVRWLWGPSPQLGLAFALTMLALIAILFILRATR